MRGGGVMGVIASDSELRSALKLRSARAFLPAAWGRANIPQSAPGVPPKVPEKALGDEYAGNNEVAGAGDGVRTRDTELGKLVLYQLSYARSGK